MQEELNITEMNEKFKQQNGYIAKTGIKLTEVREGFAKGRIELDATSHNPYGYVHGGCIFTLADTVGGTAALTFGSPITTLSGEIHYLNPAKDTAYLEASANIIKNGRQTVVLEVEIVDDSESEIALVTLTFFKLS